MLAVSHDGLEAVPPDKLIRNKGQGGSRQTICGFGRKTVRVGAIIALAKVVIAAVVGGVVASRKPHRTNSSTSTASGDASPTPSSSSNPKSTGSTAAPTSSSFLLAASNLAAASWNETTNEKVVVQNRVYYQDTKGNIIESAWNSSTGSWYVSTTLGMAKNGTPIAVAVTAPPDSDSFVSSIIRCESITNWNSLQKMNVHYLNETNNLREWFTTNGVTWSDGNLNSQNIVASDTSALSSVWHAHDSCVGCSNTLLVVYQDSSATVNLGNLTSSGWIWSALNTNAVVGSGMSLDMMWSNNSLTSLRLYYQTSNAASNLHLCSLNWGFPAADDEAGIFISLPPNP